MPIRRTLAALLLALFPALASCGDPSGPKSGVEPGDLVFIREAPGTPPLTTNDTTFWVTKGDGQEVELRYTNGHDCLEFKIPGDGLLTRPDGTPIRDGDRVQITIRRVDLQRFVFEFLPAGLRFSASDPAELRISYRYADRDFNGDGVVDARDNAARFGIWRQEAGQSTWDSLVTIRDNDLEELRADVRGFTRFAVASD